MKWHLLSLLLITACSVAPKPNPVNWSEYELPDQFRNCFEADHTPRRLPDVRTPKELATYANRLELSREALIKQRDLCNAKRASTVMLYDRLHALAQERIK